jgi:hypothetical protein
MWIRKKWCVDSAASVWSITHNAHMPHLYIDIFPIACDRTRIICKRTSIIQYEKCKAQDQTALRSWGVWHKLPLTLKSQNRCSWMRCFIWKIVYESESSRWLPSVYKNQWHTVIAITVRMIVTNLHIRVWLNQHISNIHYTWSVSTILWQGDIEGEKWVSFIWVW